MSKNKLNILGFSISLKGELDPNTEKFINKKFKEFLIKTNARNEKATNLQLLAIIINITNDLLNERERTKHLKEEMLFLMEEIENKMDLLS